MLRSLINEISRSREAGGIFFDFARMVGVESRMAPVFHRRLRSNAFCEWITAFRLAMAEYDCGMVKTPLNVDLLRLRQFLKALESDAQITRADVHLAGHEIEILKREIADLEGILNGSPDHGTRAFLFRIPIDYGAQRVHGP